ncbi:MAG: diacylglycerol kinase family protein [Trebonia sp.]|jgi:diacylglycerol kinase family enzyme
MSEDRPGRPSAGQRLAALATLACLAAATVLLLAEVVRNFLPLLGAALSLILCVLAGWYVVSRRGAARLAAGVIMAAALGLAITSLLFAEIRIWRVAVAAVLAAASVVSARYALRRSPGALGTAAGRRAVTAARHPVLIMNLKSGGGKAERFGLAQECRTRGIETVVLGPGDDLLRLAEDAVARGADVIGMAGGDGSQALVATVAARSGLPYVCVPAGTRNHFALDLGLDRDDVVGALDAFAAGTERRIDLASVNGRTFVNNASLGLYASITESAQYRDAKLRTAAAVLPDILGPDAAPLDLSFTGPDGTTYPSAQMILVSNNPYQLAHAGGRGTRKRIDGGVLGIVTARITSAGEAAQFTALQAAGQTRRFAGWLDWSAGSFEIRSAGPVRLGVDGETLAMDPPLLFESRPGALRVRLPPHALGVSPAARAVRILARSTAADLARVTAGTTTAAGSSVRASPRHARIPQDRPDS